MVIVERNAEGRIVGLRLASSGEQGETISVVDEEFSEFLRESGAEVELSQLLSLSDVSIIRVLEDLVDLLIKKKVILLTELPEEAQEKLRERKALRHHLNDDSFIVDDIL
ncbi:MAG: hypothetical protein CSA34_05900 [Desulfobulbus propionicus]|nr:MAG: hypothetical protein CSA34_05900 [Desulfobulbus propionicus]